MRWKGPTSLGAPTPRPPSNMSLTRHYRSKTPACSVGENKFSQSPGDANPKPSQESLVRRIDSISRNAMRNLYGSSDASVFEGRDTLIRSAD